MKKQQDLIFSIILLLLIIISLIFFYPKISGRYLSFRRQQILNEFITDTKKTNQINLQKYWQLREFYCPGYTTFDSTSAYKNQVFLAYFCPTFKSQDQIIIQAEYDKKIDQIKKINSKLRFKNTNQVIYKLDSDHIKIIFVVPASRMKKVIGYFDYGEKDKDLTKDKYWYNHTIVSSY